jgi:hypothetical protein
MVLRAWMSFCRCCPYIISPQLKRADERSTDLVGKEACGSSAVKGIGKVHKLTLDALDVGVLRKHPRNMVRDLEVLPANLFHASRRHPIESRMRANLGTSKASLDGVVSCL